MMVTLAKEITVLYLFSLFQSCCTISIFFAVESLVFNLHLSFVLSEKFTNNLIKCIILFRVFNFSS